jgi:hypothetical protein
MVIYDLSSKRVTISLESKALMSSITFGFELEAILLMDRFEKNPNPQLIVKLKECFSNISFKLDEDDSIEVNTEIKDPRKRYAFEAKFGVFPFTPLYLNKTLKGLQSLNNVGIVTNSSCGFHIHLGFPKMTREAGAWLILAIADDAEFQKTLIKFKEFDFFSPQYADTRFLTLLSEALYERNYKKLADILTTNKYRVIRLHPQGTVEWRGPRDFLNKENPGVIKEFVLHLYKIVSWMNNAFDLKVLPTTGFTREDFENISLNFLDFSYQQTTRNKLRKLVSNYPVSFKKLLGIININEIFNIHATEVDGRLRLDITNCEEDPFKQEPTVNYDAFVLKDVDIVTKKLHHANRLKIVQKYKNCTFTGKLLFRGTISAEDCLFKETEFDTTACQLNSCTLRDVNLKISRRGNNTLQITNSTIANSFFYCKTGEFINCNFKGGTIDIPARIKNCKWDSTTIFHEDAEFVK